jgi:hypothetical protein
LDLPPYDIEVNNPATGLTGLVNPEKAILTVSRIELLEDCNIVQIFKKKTMEVETMVGNTVAGAGLEPATSRL